MNTAAQKLLELDRLSAVFKPGQTALGHHWILSDGENNQVGRTKLFYEGSGKTVGRVLRATGMSTTGPIHARVLTADGTEVCRVYSRRGKDGRVEVTDATGAALGRARRSKLSLELMGPGSDAVLARIARANEEDLAFPIETPGGERLAVLTKQKLESGMPSIAEMVFLPDLADNQIAFQATMHLGFAGSRQYHLLVEHRPDSEPLAALLALSPVIAAYAY